jgi:hypothetical protein
MRLRRATRSSGEICPVGVTPGAAVTDGIIIGPNGDAVVPVLIIIGAAVVVGLKISN